MSHNTSSVGRTPGEGGNGPSRVPRCFRCGRLGHVKADCPSRLASTGRHSEVARQIIQDAATECNSRTTVVATSTPASGAGVALNGPSKRPAPVASFPAAKRASGPQGRKQTKGNLTKHTNNYTTVKKAAEDDAEKEEKKETVEKKEPRKSKKEAQKQKAEATQPKPEVETSPGEHSGNIITREITVGGRVHGGDNFAATDYIRVRSCCGINTEDDGRYCKRR
ncbi:hypothetical protein V8F33_005911 [Rhypophila sp. PSN 637]